MTKYAEIGRIPMATSLTFVGHTAPPEQGDVMLRAHFDVPLAELFRGLRTFEHASKTETGEMMANRGATIVFGVTRKQLIDCDRADTSHMWSGELQWHDYVLLKGVDGEEVLIEVQVNQIVLPNPLGTPALESPRIIVGSVHGAQIALKQEQDAA